MPYRKMPGTDVTRLEALRALHTKADSTPSEARAFSETNHARLKTFLPVFQKELEERGTALSVQSDATSRRLETEEECRTFVSHFYRVFNLGVTRKKYKAYERAHFQLDINSESVPDLRSEESIRTRAENIINGDKKRIAAGGAEMSNPTRDEVETVYARYTAALADQSAKKDAYEKEQKDVENIRAEADELIRDIWDEIEFNFRKEEAPALRRKAREYGVVYLSRPGETEEVPVAELPQQTEQTE